jgi:hypothetical protein
MNTDAKKTPYRKLFTKSVVIRKKNILHLHWSVLRFGRLGQPQPRAFCPGPFILI